MCEQLILTNRTYSFREKIPHNHMLSDVLDSEIRYVSNELIHVKDKHSNRKRLFTSYSTQSKYYLATVLFCT